jgi:hypothetical protein
VFFYFPFPAGAAAGVDEVVLVVLVVLSCFIERS